MYLERGFIVFDAVIFRCLLIAGGIGNYVAYQCQMYFEFY